MIFLPLFLLLLPLIINGIRPFGKCDKDACLQYSATCDEGRGVWTAKTKNEMMDDSECTLNKDPTIRKEGEFHDYLYLDIEIVSPTQWIFSISDILPYSFSITSPRIELKLENGWNLTVDGEIKEPESNRTEDKSNNNIKVWKVVINESTPLLELFSGAMIFGRFSTGGNQLNATYDGSLFWAYVAERSPSMNEEMDEEPMSCARSDAKPAFLVILIVYAVFATIVALLLVVMIYCIAREVKYSRVPTKSVSIKRKKSKEEHKKEIPTESKLPDLDPTAVETRELTVPQAVSKEVSATDISRLKTESRTSKKN